MRARAARDQRAVGHLGHVVPQGCVACEVAIDLALEPLRGEPGRCAEDDASADDLRGGVWPADDRVLERLDAE